MYLQYSTDVSKVTNLVTIPQHFDYLTYVEHRLQKVRIQINITHSLLFCAATGGFDASAKRYFIKTF